MAVQQKGRDFTTLLSCIPFQLSLRTIVILSFFMTTTRLKSLPLRSENNSQLAFITRIHKWSRFNTEHWCVSSVFMFSISKKQRPSFVSATPSVLDACPCATSLHFAPHLYYQMLVCFPSPYLACAHR